MIDRIILGNVCTLCKEPMIKTANIQRRLFDRTFVEMAMDLKTADPAELKAALEVINGDLEFLMDGDYRCAKCGKPHRCVYCGVDIHFQPGKNETICPQCKRDVMFVDFEDIRKNLKMQYEAEMAARGQ
jgi:hypothetical protein